MKGNELAVWVDEFDFSGATSEVELSLDVGEAGVTTLASGAEEFVPLLTKVSLSQNGYLHGVVAGFAAALEERLGDGAVVVSLLVEKSRAACVAYVFEDAPGFEMKFAGPAVGVVTLNGRWAAAAQVRRGLRVFDGVLSATGALASVDFGAPSALGGRAFLHVASIAGAALDAEVAVQSSADGASWVDEGGFVLSSVGAYAVALPSALGRFVRLFCSDLGGATAIGCMGVVCMAV